MPGILVNSIFSSHAKKCVALGHGEGDLMVPLPSSSRVVGRKGDFLAMKMQIEVVVVTIPSTGVVDQF